MPPVGMRRLMPRAVVLGGSVAGLMAARVLSDHADEVVIIERDAPDSGDGPRPGVPQGSQVHGLLPAGQQQFERWFPGFIAEAIAAGAVVPPFGSFEFIMNGALRTAKPIRLEQPGLVSTRPFLENLIRSRTLAVPNIRVVTGRAEGLIVEGERVVGARYVGDDGAAEISAGMVVDAMGRSSRLSDWLADHGFDRPPMQRMGIKLNYATAMFRRDPNMGDTWGSIAFDDGSGGVPRIGGVNPVEGDRWMVLIAGYADDRPSRDPEEFVKRCVEQFPAKFGEVATGCEMIGPVITYHQADSRRRDFHQAKHLPAGLVAAGDAVASFNPIYGQGMTSAALHASCLSAYLRADPDLDRPARRYFELVRVVVDAAWQTSTLSDLGLAHVDGPYPPGYALISRISGRIARASITDDAVNHKLGLVTMMLAHPNSLMSPAFVLRAMLRGSAPSAAR
ncbi:hydroxylase [Catellatospora methionotrophica]|uniref:Hydroxylase n=2 Tax=Catellatospora methionotrophica TaxID=121620 RepID=A0A8J3PHL2_9ACTN|nr:hydroxylase [Catellatospora methionotrophica]